MSPARIGNWFIGVRLSTIQIWTVSADNLTGGSPLCAICFW